MGGENQFVYFTTYLFVGGMICTLVLQTDLLNRAIMTGDTLSVFPMFQCFWIGVRRSLPVVHISISYQLGGSLYLMLRVRSRASLEASCTTRSTSASPSSSGSAYPLH